MNRIYYLREKFPWFGQHSGYDLLCNYMKCEKASDKLHVIEVEKYENANLIQNILYNIVEDKVKYSKTYGCESFWSELFLYRKTIGKCKSIVHLLYVERMLGLLSVPFFKNKINLLGTVHQPVRFWKSGRHNPEILRSLDGLIVLDSVSMNFFQDYLQEPVSFVRHGVDVDFFRPRHEDSEQEAPVRCVFSGVWLRDLETLCRVVDKVSTVCENVQFEMIIPDKTVASALSERISIRERIRFHRGLTDEQLKTLYQSCSILLLPLIDCTANNALLEGIASGLSVVSNRIGGVADYTTPDFAALFEVGDADGMSEEILRLADNRELLRKQRLAARRFAVENLDWRIITAKTVEVYGNICTRAGL